MRPLRFVFLVFCFIAIPIVLTCTSLLSGSNEGPNALGYQQRSRLRALFSFSTPSSLFPPSAIISLTTDNSTFFLARPAAFGPSLPSKGLSGRLWVGKGFGDDSFLSEEDLKISGFELGCSDVPGWGEEHKTTPDHNAPNEKSTKETVDKPIVQPDGQIATELSKRDDLDRGSQTTEDDGTDDHLHRPLPDSNPATPVKVGEPANADPNDKSKKPTHADIESLQESAAIAGKIVMLSRGGCGFLEKVKWAQRRGGIAVIVGDNERNGQLTIMYAKGDTSNVTIPAIFTSYTSAHLLSSLVPPETMDASLAEGGKVITAQSKDSQKKGKLAQNKDVGPVFTTVTATRSQSTPASPDATKASFNHNGWMQNVLQAVGLDDESLRGEDTRRPPGSGNIVWVQVKDWHEDEIDTTTSGTQSTILTGPTSTKPARVRTTTSKSPGDDDFVIGVQDWRDTEVIAPKKAASTSSATTSKTRSPASSSTSGALAQPTALKGGSIIPGSGEYEAPNHPDVLAWKQQGPKDKHGQTTEESDSSLRDKIKNIFKPDDATNSETAGHHQDREEGLWVTLTPTSVSTSPFFDTLLVLVISPLVTLTFVYGLLLLRSRIRRRRWRAPKSVIERLPVRTYHTVSTASSTTSSQHASPQRSLTGSPQLRPEPVRARQRSQTTTGVLSPGSPSTSPTPEKSAKKNMPKKYRGRQIECVVCLEEYVDGESKVMSLPCGHEFHAECITPWLVNRRRTCPICKGDVVRSLQKSAIDSVIADDAREADEETSDDVQERAATTIPDDASAAIPIPDRSDAPSLLDEDVERGEEVDNLIENENDPQDRPTASRWRGIINASVSQLSGDTLWRANSVNDRNR